VERDSVTLSYDEAMAACLLLAEAADASVASEELRDTWGRGGPLDDRNDPWTHR
jgi:hypothetical protein